MNNLDYLIEYLLEERKIKCDIPKNVDDKIALWRSLVNQRMPNHISDEYLQKEDEFLKEYFKSFDIVKVSEINTLNNSRIAIFKGDITKIEIDAIVNPANEMGLGCFVPLHNCLDNQITSYAGVRLRLEDKEIMDKIKVLETGKVFITKGYNLKANYVIHTVGPIINDFVHDYQIEELKSCYINSLNLAKENGIRTIAFPSISTGIFNFPKDKAAEVALSVVKDYLKDDTFFEKIVFVCYSNVDYNFYINESNK